MESYANVLFNIVATNHMWLLNTRKIANAITVKYTLDFEKYFQKFLY